MLQKQVADAKKKGAKLLLGGTADQGQGQLVRADGLGDVDHSMLVMRDESFGPIIGLQAVADDEAAVDLMNDTEYGLTAGVYCRDEKRAKKILKRVDAGTVYWNCCDRVSPRLPWSGVKHSGIGLTLSTYGIQTFTRPKAWHLRSNERPLAASVARMAAASLRSSGNVIFRLLGLPTTNLVAAERLDHLRLIRHLLDARPGKGARRTP